MPTFWTIQHIDKWRDFQNTGVLTSDIKYAEPHFINAYKWIAKQMTSRMPDAHHPGIFPIWVWYKYDDKYRPDLRRRAHLAKGDRGVLIEFEESFDNVLLSDFMNWHLVLNADKETKAWHSIFINPADTKRIAKSVVQACLWQVKIDKVKSVKEFTAR